MLKKFLLILILIQINLLAYQLKFIKKIKTNVIIGTIFSANNKIILCDKIYDKLKFYTLKLNYEKEISSLYYGNKKISLKTNNLDVSDFNELIFTDNYGNIIIFDTKPILIHLIKAQTDITPLNLYFLNNRNIIAKFNNKLKNISIINNKATIVEIYNLSLKQEIIGKHNNYIFINDLKNKEIIVITDYGKEINRIQNPIADNTKKTLILNSDIILIPKIGNFIFIITQTSHKKIKLHDAKISIQDATILNNNIYFLFQNGEIHKYKIIINNNIDNK